MFQRAIIIFTCSCCVYLVSPMAFYRINSMGADKMKEATRYSQSMKHLLKKIFNAENPVLIDLPEWGQAPPAGTVTPEESEVNDTLFLF